jgi:hypothetical protein
MNLASMSSADDSEGTSVASLLLCHEKEAEIKVAVTMLEKDVSQDSGSRGVVTYNVDLGIGVEVAAASSSARSVVHDEGTEAKKDVDAGTVLEGDAAASCAAARARQNEGSKATKLKALGELRLESGWDIDVHSEISRHWAWGSDGGLAEEGCARCRERVQEGADVVDTKHSLSEGLGWNKIITHDGDIRPEEEIFSSARRAVQEEGIATIFISSAQKGSLALRILAGCALHKEAGMDESIGDLNDNVRHQLSRPA